MNASNGHKRPLRKRKSRVEIKETILASDPLRDYHSTRTAFFGELFVQQLPPWRLWTGRMMMTSDPLVRFGLNVRNAALMAAEVEVKCSNPIIKKWVEDQWEYAWTQHRLKMCSAKEMGFTPLFIEIKEKAGLLVIDGMREFAPEDCRALQSSGKICGMRVSGQPVFGPQKLWLTFGARFGSAYGVGCLRRMYPPWYEKWMEHGAKRLLQLRMIKDSYIGDIFWYPPNMIVELPDGRKMSWRDLMREIGENRLSGGALTLPRLYDNNGKELTGYTPPQDVAGGSQIFEWNDNTDKGMLQGADVPYEVIQAAETGSGFSGRAIPFMVVLSVCTEELTEIVQCFDEQVLRPLAWLNWGGDPDYQIVPKSLVDSWADDTSASPMGGGAIGGQPGAAPRPPSSPDSAGSVVGGGAIQFGEEFKEENHPRSNDGKFTSKQKALEGLKALGDFDASHLDEFDQDWYKGHAPSPFPFNAEEANRVTRLYGSKVNSLSYETKTVNLSELQGTQDTIEQEKTKNRIEEGLREDSPATVVKYKGKLWIVDGTHRLAVEKLSDKKEAKVRYADLDSEQYAEESAVGFGDSNGPLHAPPGGVTIHGVKYEGGEFIPKEVINELDEGEKRTLRAGTIARHIKKRPDLAADRPKVPFEKMDEKAQIKELNRIVKEGGKATVKTTGGLEIKNLKGPPVKLKGESQDRLDDYASRGVSNTWKKGDYKGDAYRDGKLIQVGFKFNVRSIASLEESPKEEPPKAEGSQPSSDEGKAQEARKEAGKPKKEKVEHLEFDLTSTGRDDWDKVLKDEPDRFQVETTHMSVDDYLKRVQHKRHEVDSDKVEKYAQEFEKKTPQTLPTPTMWFSNKYSYDQGYSPSWHDGTHRALALKKAGIKDIPILTIWDKETSQHSEEPHSFSSTQFNLPGDLAFEVRMLGERIPQEDLAGDGREMNPHITVKYGLHTDDVDDVRRIVQNLPPVAVRFGKASCFPANEETVQRGGDAYDVVKIEIESDALHALNKAISEGTTCTDTFPEYKPHCTIAYVHPGLGELWASRLNAMEGRVAVFDKLIFSDKNRGWNPITLAGSSVQFDEDSGGPLHAPPGGVTIHGVRYKGGEFIPHEVISTLSDSDKQKLTGGTKAREGKKIAASDPKEHKTLKEAEAWAKANGAPVTFTKPDEAAMEIYIQVERWIEAMRKQDRLSSDPPSEEEIIKNWTKTFRAKKLYEGDKPAFKDLNPELHLELQKSLNDNHTNTAYNEFVGVHGDAPVIYRRAEKGRSAAAEWRAGIHIYDSPFWKGEGVDELKPGQATAGGMGGYAAVIRHEYGHKLFGLLTREQEKEWRSLVPSGDEVEKGLTTYAAKNQEETFCELFAICTDKRYQPGVFPPWVDELHAKQKEWLL